MKCSNIQMIGAPEDEDKNKGHEKILEQIVVENFPFQETQRVPNMIKPKVKYPKTHINHINRDQTQRTNIKAAREKQQIIHKGIPIRIIADLFHLFLKCSQNLLQGRLYPGS